jgi:hypothetical protein
MSEQPGPGSPGWDVPALPIPYTQEEWDAHADEYEASKDESATQHTPNTPQDTPLPNPTGGGVPLFDSPRGDEPVDPSKDQPPAPDAPHETGRPAKKTTAKKTTTKKTAAKKEAK